MQKKTIVTSAITTAAVIAALIATPTLAAVARGSDAPEAGQSMHTSQPHGQQGEGKQGGPSNHGSLGQGGKGQVGKSQGSKGANGQGSMGQKMGGGSGSGGGTGGGLADVASGTLTDDQKAELAAMAEEEKLAHDLYVALDAQYEATVFTRIAKSEAKHLDAVRTLLERYELTDPTVGQEAGEFLTDETQTLYDTLLAEGSASLDAAMEAGRTVEQTDIADLTAATEGVTAPDVLTVYERLLAASEKHLVAFGG